MKKNTQDNMLIEINDKSIFYKIKKFFSNLFSKKEKKLNENEEIVEQYSNDKNKESFEQRVKVTETEESKLLNLQKQYRAGKIKAEDLTRDQILALGKLYDIQISKLRASNEIRKKKLLEIRNNLQSEK